MKMVPYRNGVLDGTIRTYYDGINQVDEIQDVRNGKLEGKYMAYDLSGHPLIEAFYSNDLLNGVVKFYDENGNVSTTIPYNKGMAEGMAFGYYPSGKKLFEQSFKANKPEGWRKTYYEDGQLYQEKLYRNGIWNGHDYREYDRNGRKVVELKMDNGRQQYLLFDADENAAEMSDVDKKLLMERIDSRQYEKEMMAKYLNIQKTVGNYFQGSF